MPGNLVFYTTPDGSGGVTERMRIAANGNVGIGTASPGTLLDVAGTIKSTGLSLNGSPLVITNPSTGSAAWAEIDIVSGRTTANEKYWNLANDASTGALRFRALNDARSAEVVTSPLTILRSGNVGIGTTSPAHKLDVAGDVRFTGLDNANGTGTICIQAGGELAFTYSNTCVPSDARLKDRIEPLQDSLAKVTRLKGVSYYWKRQVGNPVTAQQIGLLAQDVERVFPQVVSEDQHGIKSVSYEWLAAPMIEAIKELKAANDNLRATVEAQGREIEALKAAR